MLELAGYFSIIVASGFSSGYLFGFFDRLTRELS